MDQGFRDPVSPGGFTVGQALERDRGDEELVAVHCP